MGRIIRHEIIGYRCEVRCCGVNVMVDPAHPASSTWHEQVDQLRALVDQGWALVLHPQLRSYCPVHADRAWGCSCRTHPERRHLCTSHDSDAASQVWDGIAVPNRVQEFLEVHA